MTVTRGCEVAQDGYWVVSVDRETGEANTSSLIIDRDDAWTLSLKLETPNTFTMVVPRRPTAPRRDQQSVP